MNKPTLSRRKFVGGSMLALGTASLPACGGGETSAEDPNSPATGVDDRLTAQGGTSKAPAPAVPGTNGSKQSTAAIAPGALFTSLKINATQTGTFVYAATVLPLQGQVPLGATLLSPDDASLRASVFSRWSDGSAAVMVASGTVTVTNPGELTLQLQAGSPTKPDTPLTVNQLSRLVTSVKVALGGLGTIELTDLTKPERIWWTNGNTLCARYRVAAPSHPTLEAVIDIHSFGERALVEVVLENAKVNSASPAKPGVASYTAVVSVNGNVAATVQSTGAPEGAHTAFRAWYASAWVGGDPGLRAMQNVADLQKHPLLFRMDRGGNDVSGYAADTYLPWTAGRQRASGMGAAGDHPSIGPLPQWEARFLQTGSPAAARATEVSTLAVLGYNVNYRDSSTGMVPTFADIGAKAQVSGSVRWPSQTNANDTMMWETAHSPAAGLMAFVARPSPVYIEIAQKVAVWNGTYTGDATPNWTSGTFGYWYQLRGRAWGIRSLAHAAFLTPDGQAWRNACLTAITNNVTYMTGWVNNAKAKLGCTWDYAPDSLQDHASNSPHFQVAAWQHHYLVTEYHKLASANLLTGAQQQAVNALADWLALQPVRWVNERSNGGWRYVPYSTAIGPSKTAISSPATWDQQMALFMTDAPTAVTGPWMTFFNNVASSYASFQTEGTAGATYVSYLWAALAAAAERGVAGATTAWSTVTTQVTNLDSWRAGFIGDPRWGAAPRIAQVALTAPPAGSPPGGLQGDVWTPERGADGKVTSASWASVPTGRWVTVAGTRLDALDAAVKAAVPGWGGESLAWDGVLNGWSGFAIDEAGSRAWILGGGHSNSHNNGLYRFDALKMAWAVEQMPSDRTPWSAGYRNLTTTASSTFCPESNAQAAAKVTAGTLAPVNDWFYDELAWDRRPTARHTYSSMVYVPETDELVMVCRRLWRFSRAQGRWTYKRLIRDTSDMWMDAEGIVATYDERTKEVLTSSTGSNALYRATGYKLDSNQWTDWVAPWNRGGGDANVRHGRRLMCMVPPAKVSWQYDSQGRYYLYDLDTRSVVQSGDGVQYAGGLKRDDFAPGIWWYDAPGVTYIPSLNRYWLWTKMADGAIRCVEVDPTTTPWTLRPTNHQGAVPNPHPSGNLMRKVVYYPALNAVVLTDLASREVSLFKVA